MSKVKEKAVKAEGEAHKGQTVQEKQAFAHFGDFLGSGGVVALGIVFIAFTCSAIAVEQAVLPLFGLLFNVLPVFIPALLLVLWVGAKVKGLPSLAAPIAFFAALVGAVVAPFAVADTVIYTGEVGVLASMLLMTLLLVVGLVAAARLSFVLSSNPALNTVMAVALGVGFASVSGTVFLAMSVGAIVVTDILWVLSFIVAAVWLAAIMVGRYSGTIKIMRALCAAVILVSINLIAAPLADKAVIDLSPEKQFKISNEAALNLAMVKKPVEVVLFLPKSQMAEDAKNKVLARLLGQYLKGLSDVNPALSYSKSVGEARDGMFAILVVNEEGAEDYVYLPASFKKDELERDLVPKIFVAAGLDAEAGKLGLYQKPKQMEMSDEDAGRVWRLALVVALLFIPVWLIFFVYHLAKSDEAKRRERKLEQELIRELAGAKETKAKDKDKDRGRGAK